MSVEVEAASIAASIVYRMMGATDIDVIDRTKHVITLEHHAGQRFLVTVQPVQDFQNASMTRPIPEV